jgi:acetoacetate decarboxylase
MKTDDVRASAFAMPLTSPSCPKGPCSFVITCRTDPEALRALVREPLAVGEPIVRHEFIAMPLSTGFGSCGESGQVIPVRFQGQEGGWVHAMHLKDDAPIAGGREIRGFPRKPAEPALRVEQDTLVGTLDLGSVRLATGTMGRKPKALDPAGAQASLEAPGFLLEIIPHVDCTPLNCELVRYFQQDIRIKGAWSGPAGLELHDHALAPVAALPVPATLSAVHVLADLTRRLGEVVHDYLAAAWTGPRQPITWGNTT